MFTEKDAQALGVIAASAPLQNMQHAQHVSDLLNRFHTWFAGLPAEHKSEAPTAPTLAPGARRMTLRPGVPRVAQNHPTPKPIEEGDSIVAPPGSAEATQA